MTFRTLKRRQTLVMREVPVPPALLGELEAFGILNKDRPAGCSLWEHQGLPVNRITAYRWVKTVMKAADITGAQACPKGLRHGYGIHAVRCGIQLKMLQKWMGHAAMTTTAIYTNAVGAEELALADRMWIQNASTNELAHRLPEAVRTALIDLLTNCGDAPRL